MNATMDTTRKHLYDGAKAHVHHQVYISQRPSRPATLQHYFPTLVFTLSLAVLLCRTGIQVEASGDAVVRQSEKSDGMKQEFPVPSVYLQRWSGATYPRPPGMEVSAGYPVDSRLRMQSPPYYHMDGGDYDTADAADTVPAWQRQRRSYQQEKPVAAGLLSNRFPAGWDKRAQTFVRFGKRAQTFVRFGKRAQTFVRFG